MTLWYRGFAKDIDGKKAKTDRRFSCCNQTVYYRDLKSYFDDDFYSILDIWDEWKTFNKMPFGGGTRDQPWLWLRLIKTMESIWRSLQKK